MTEQHQMDTHANDLPAVLTIEEAAKVFRIGRSAAYLAARTGDIPTIRIGGSLRVPRHRLNEMLGYRETADEDRAFAETALPAGVEALPAA